MTRNVQSGLVPTLALLAAAPLMAQQVERTLPPRQRIEIERQAEPQRFMSVLMNRRPRLGVTVNLRAGSTDSVGALVQSVTPGGPAAKAGIRSGDIITRLDGTVLVNRAADRTSADRDQSPPGLRLVELAARLKPDDTVTVELRRGKDRRTVRVITDSEGANEFAYTVPGAMWKQGGDDSVQGFLRRMPDMQMKTPLYMGELGPAGQTRMRVF